MPKYLYYQIDNAPADLQLSRAYLIHELNGQSPTNTYIRFSRACLVTGGDLNFIPKGESVIVEVQFYTK